MTTDDFTEAAREKAESQAQEWLYDGGRIPTSREAAMAGASAWGFVGGANWAKKYIAEQRPTEAEIEIVACTILAQTDGRAWDDIDEGERREYRRYALAVLIAGRSVNE